MNKDTHSSILHKITKIIAFAQHMKCPFFNSHPNQQTIQQYLDQYQQLLPNEFLDNTSILPFLLPGHDRIMFLEWMFHLYPEHDILDNIRIKPSRNNDFPEKIEIAVRQLGIACNSDNIRKSILGKNGLNDSLNFLYNVCEFIFMSIKLTQYNSTQVLTQNIRLLNYISRNHNKVFSNKCRLFPPHFPSLKDISCEKLKQVTEAYNEWNQELVKANSSFQEILKNNPQQEGQPHAVYEDLFELKKELQLLRDYISDLNYIYERGYYNQLKSISVNDFSNLEDIVHETYQFQKSFSEYYTNVGLLWLSLSNLTNSEEISLALQNSPFLKTKNISNIRQELMKLHQNLFSNHKEN